MYFKIKKILIISLILILYINLLPSKFVETAKGANVNFPTTDPIYSTPIAGYWIAPWDHSLDGQSLVVDGQNKSSKYNPTLMIDDDENSQVHRFANITLQNQGYISHSATAMKVANSFVIEWIGWIRIDTVGTYTFRALHDDGVRVWVNNSLVVNHWGNTGARWTNGNIALNEGYYPIKIRYYEDGGDQTMRLAWQGPGGLNQDPIPSSRLYFGDANLLINGGHNYHATKHSGMTQGGLWGKYFAYSGESIPRWVTNRIDPQIVFNNSVFNKQGFWVPNGWIVIYPSSPTYAPSGKSAGDPYLPGLNLNLSGNLDIGSNCQINADGKGYVSLNKSEVPVEHRYAGPGNNGQKAAGYGGRGGVGSGLTYGNTESNKKHPYLLGSGARISFEVATRNLGGAGGGRIRIEANAITLRTSSGKSGRISTQGYNASAFVYDTIRYGANYVYEGGGSGGSVDLITKDLNMDVNIGNVISAMGGTGGKRHGNSSPAGGGGRIGIKTADYLPALARAAKLYDTYEDTNNSEYVRLHVLGAYPAFSVYAGGGSRDDSGQDFNGYPGSFYYEGVVHKATLDKTSDKTVLGKNTTANFTAEYTIPSAATNYIISGGSASNPKSLPNWEFKEDFDSSKPFLFYNLTLDGGYFVMDGEYFFNNLTLANGAVVTHSGANNEGNYGGVRAGLKISVLGELKLSGNSSIDVSGKGYPGGGGDGDHGRGPDSKNWAGGRSGGEDSGCNTKWYGGGGGYGGQGRRVSGGENGYGNIAASSAFPNPRIYGSVEDPTDLGSGGGGSHDEDIKWFSCRTEIGRGGAGGGIIDISANTVNIANGSIIKSNGQNGYGGGAEPGGGSGGSVNIKTNIWNNQNSGSPQVAPGWSGRNLGSDGAQAGTVHNEFDGNSLGGNIMANGGNGGGGGGRIAIKPLNGILYLRDIINYPSYVDIISSDGTITPSDGKVIWPANSNSGIRNYSITTKATVPNNVDICNDIKLTLTPNGTDFLASDRVCMKVNEIEIEGDVYAKGQVDLSSFKTIGSSVIAGNSVNIGDAGTSKILTPYTINLFNEKFLAKIDSRLKYFEQEKGKQLEANSLSYGTWYLQTADNLPNHSTQGYYPEGGVWYIKPTSGTTVDLGATNFIGRGTLVVDGNLRINGNITTSSGSMVGIIAKGDITVGNNVGRLDAAVYAHRKNITVVNTDVHSFNLNGLLAASGNINLSEVMGTAISLKYNKDLNKYPLPGFRELASLQVCTLVPN